MNGGRLSNDETFLLGVEELRTQLSAAAPDIAAAERALARIAVRFPEEADQLSGLWRQPDHALCARRLDEVVEQHAADSAEEN
ncbi:MAG TPA: hypothetical protein VIE13_13170 [Terriglobales bacterium]|jgi:hypothetical protein